MNPYLSTNPLWLGDRSPRGLEQCGILIYASLLDLYAPRGLSRFLKMNPGPWPSLQGDNGALLERNAKLTEIEEVTQNQSALS